MIKSNNLSLYPQNLNIPDIVISDYSIDDKVRKMPEDLSEVEHPQTRSKRHFILGDRFHTSTNPHKSKLCAYHNIDLCQRGLAIATSMQESENHRKNAQRLRSTCQQTFEVHYMFNYLMDFYLNEAVMKKQIENLIKTIKSSETIKRNIYGKFIIVNKE